MELWCWEPRAPSRHAIPLTEMEVGVPKELSPYLCNFDRKRLPLYQMHPNRRGFTVSQHGYTGRPFTGGNQRGESGDIVHGLAGDLNNKVSLPKPTLVGVRAFDDLIHLQHSAVGLWLL